MLEENLTPITGARSVAEILKLDSASIEAYFKIPAWNVWTSGIFNSPDYAENVHRARLNPQGIVVPPNHVGWYYIHDKIVSVKRGLPMPFGTAYAFDVPGYILEPLMSNPKEDGLFLYPDDLRILLRTP